MHPFCLSRTKFIADWVRNNDISAWAAKRRGLKISHCFSQKLQWILFSRDKTDANLIPMTLNIRNYRFIAIFLLNETWTNLLSAQLATSWADNRIVCPPRKAMSSWAGWTIELSHFSSDMKNYENTFWIMDEFVKICH